MQERMFQYMTIFDAFVEVDIESLFSYFYTNIRCIPIQPIIAFTSVKKSGIEF